MPVGTVHASSVPLSALGARQILKKAFKRTEKLDGIVFGPIRWRAGWNSEFDCAVLIASAVVTHDNCPGDPGSDG